MSKKPSFQFYPGDWLKDPCLRKCAPSTKGIYIDMLCLMHLSEHRGVLSGTIDQLARMVGCFPDEMTAATHELGVTKTLRVTETNKIVTLENRRMLREQEDRLNNALRQKKHREIRRNGQSNAKITIPSSSSSSSSKEKVEKESRPVTPKKRPETDPPEHFEITGKLAEWAAEKAPGVDLDSETEKFLDHHRSRGNRFRDWPAAWRKWIRNAVEFTQARPSSSGNGHRKLVPPRFPEEGAPQHEWDELMAKWGVRLGGSPTYQQVKSAVWARYSELR